MIGRSKLHSSIVNLEKEIKRVECRRSYNVQVVLNSEDFQRIKNKYEESENEIACIIRAY